MSTFNVNIYYTQIVKTWDELELDPIDYLKCENEEQVMDWIVEETSPSICIESGEIDIDTFNSDILIPEEFWEEWRKLKNENS